MGKIKNKRCLTLFLCIAILCILIGPYYLYVFRPKERDYNIQPKKVKWIGVISFWDFPRLDQKTGTQYGWIQEKIRAFEREYPGVYIDFKPLSWDKGSIQLDTAIKMGTVPDIIPVGNDYGMIGKGILEPLDPYLSVEEIRNFKESAIQAVTYNGHVWAMPWMITTYAMFLNLDLFHEKGVAPPSNGNWTYKEFIEKLQQLTFDSNGDGKVDHYGFNSFIQPGYYNTWGIILSDGAQIFDEQMKYRFNDEKTVSGLQKLIDLKNKYHVTHPDFGINHSNDAWTSFYKDKNVAVYPAGTWAINVLEGLKNEGIGFNYTVCNYPTGDLNTPFVMSSMVGSYGISKQEDPQKKEMCVEFLKFLVKDEYQSQLYRLGVFPAKKSVGNIYEDQPMMTMIYHHLENTKIIPTHPYWREIDEILQNEIRQGVLGKKTVGELLKDAEEKVMILLRAIEKE